MVTPGFHAARFVRPALLTITLYFSSFAIAEALPLGMVAFQQNYFTSAVDNTHFDNATAACVETYTFMNLSASITGQVFKNVRGIVDYNGTSGYGSTYGCLTDLYRYYDNSLWQANYFETGRILLYQSCPSNSRIHLVIGWPPLGDGCVCSATDGYVADTTGTSCVLPSACPTHASGTPCACDAGYQFDAAGTSCVPSDTCPQVKALKPLPEEAACAQVLESSDSTQAQKDAACGALTDNLKSGMTCFRNKLSGLSPAIPLKVTSDIRDIAYQAHLREIWDKMEALVELEDDPIKQAACATRRAEIAAEKGCDKAGPCKSEPNEVCYPQSSTQRSHCLKGRPASPNPNDAQHTQGNAFDVSEDYTLNPLQDVLDARNPPQTIPQFLDAPTNCKLNWGGMFTDNYDPIHFYAR